MDFFRIALELVLGFICLFIISRILGKTQITQITTFDFISALVLGELVGNAVFDKDIGISEIIFAIVIWGLLIYMVEFLTQKFNATRSVLEGCPTIIIKDGKLVKENLKKEKIDINQVQHMVRSKGVFSLREIQHAILETDGSISIMKKAQYDYPVRKDFSFHPAEPSLPYTLILDGELQEDNLDEANLTKEWLMAELAKKKIFSSKDVFFAEWRQDGGLHVQESDEKGAPGN
ncbi:YetF domain-containing protein [Metabacillus sp. RGM 3146]|uniref:YetF domain-containing protein n=1 Tax=Metabacillus sp. RGM 3146 TaxID=3401092 RepID=UPI003B991A22